MEKILTKDEILSAKDLHTETVYVPEWGGSVIVRTITGFERDQFEASITEGKKGAKVNLENLRARLVALSTVNEKGERIFTLADVKALGRKSASALDKVFAVAQRLSGLTSEDVEELAKNLPKGQDEDSASD